MKSDLFDKMYQATYYKKHKEKILAYNAEYRKKHREKINLQEKIRYHKKNREKRHEND